MSEGERISGAVHGGTTRSQQGLRGRHAGVTKLAYLPMPTSEVEQLLRR